MKVTLAKKINYFSVDSNFKLRLSALAKFFQEAAEIHSSLAGSSTKQLHQRGVAWILYKLEIDVRRYPDYEDEIEIVTWHRGHRGFKAFRDFYVLHQGQPIASGASVWLYFDLQGQRLQRVPKETDAMYRREDAGVFEKELDSWSPDLKFRPQTQLEVTTRLSDYDPNGHVTNTAYVDYVETLAGATMTPCPAAIKNMKIQFNKEIGQQARSVTAGWGPAGDGVWFKIFDDRQAYAAGQIQTV